ncbi:MAG: tyrosine-type recombinase/integrase [Planctomycetia bacterium]|nr:tyrosine-type recombinase/integrase [Planctomycetia bacterium]
MKKKAPSGFPLKLHATGYWYAYLNGKIRYFGKGDAMEALADYQKRLGAIMSGEEDKQKIVAGKMTLAQLTTLYVENLQARVETGELTSRRYGEYIRVYNKMLEVIPPKKNVETLKAVDFQPLRQVLAKGCKLGRLVTKAEMIIRLFRWGAECEFYEKEPKVKQWLELPTRNAISRERSHKARFFTAEQLQRIVMAAEDTIYPKQWKAIILTAICCGFGSRDISDLRFSDLQLEKGIITLPRSKTGNERRAALWSEVVDAIRDYLETERPESEEFSDRVFLTSEGTRWNYDTEKSRVDSLGLAFRRLTKMMGIAETSFYSIRRTFRTVADEVGDFPACDLIMGHADHTMGGVYRQYIKDDRLKKVSEHVRAWYFSPDVERIQREETLRLQKVQEERWKKIHAPKKRRPTRKPEEE